MESLATYLRSAATAGRTTYFCKLDVSNMLWSCRLPQSEAGNVRFGVRGKVLGFHSLPFGWNYSPIMATELLSKSLDKLGKVPVEVVVYFDDILIAGDSPEMVEQVTLRLRGILMADGWRISTKSVTTADTHIQWMGKDLDGRNWTVTSSAEYTAGMVALWISLATCGYSQKPLRRLLGKIAWADRPGREAMTHTSGPMAWLMWGPVQATYTPLAVLKALGEAIASTLTPWQAQQFYNPGPIDWYVDAAQSGKTYVAGLWGRGTGARLWECTSGVQNQQAAELDGVERGVKLAAYTGRRPLHLGVDNLAAVWSVLRRRTRIHHRDRARCLRRIQNTLRWSGFILSLSYVPSRWNPADAISRIFKWESAGQSSRVRPLILPSPL